MNGQPDRPSTQPATLQVSGHDKVLEPYRTRRMILAGSPSMASPSHDAGSCSSLLLHLTWKITLPSAMASMPSSAIPTGKQRTLPYLRRRSEEHSCWNSSFDRRQYRYLKELPGCSVA